MTVYSFIYISFGHIAIPTIQQIESVIGNGAKATLDPAMYPPHDPNDLVKVPIIISTSPGSTSKSSQTPLPVFPTAPMLWASSKYVHAYAAVERL
jgi:hypothetical protein